MKNFLKNLTFRQLNLFLFALSVIGTIYAIVYLQNHLGLDPCPLCIFQRVGLWVMGAFALIAAIFNPKGIKTRVGLWFGALIGTLWGLGVAARHVWLTYLPADEVPACGPGLNYWVDTLPILQVFQEVLKGSGECAVVDWTLLGISLSEQTLALFIFILLVLMYMLTKIKRV